MKARRIVLWIVALALLPSRAPARDPVAAAKGTPPSAAAPVAPPASAARPSRLDPRALPGVVDWLRSEVDRGRIPGAVVLVAKDGKAVLHEAVGWSDRARGVRMTTESLHPIASASKLVTTLAALRLVEDGRLDVEAPVARYLPELAGLRVAEERRDAAGQVATRLVAPARPPTIRDLMTHRAGFTYSFFAPTPLRQRYKELGLERMDRGDAGEMLRNLATLPLAFPPGTRFEYSIATDVLGHVVERVTGRPLDAALEELVLGPLRMKDTTFHVDGPRRARVARPLADDPNPWVYDWIDPTRTPRRLSGGAGLASTASDYLKPLRVFAEGGVVDGVRLLSPETVRWAMSDQVDGRTGEGGPGPGYGWNLFNPVRVAAAGPPFPGSVGDVFWGGITGPWYFLDPKEQLIGILFIQGTTDRATYLIGFRKRLYDALSR